jgi:hypothetical protein
MTAPPIDLLDSEALDAEQVLVAWLQPIRATAVARVTGDPLPFTLVGQVGGHEDPICGTADLLVQVDTLTDRDLGYENARTEMRLTKRRLNELIVHNDTFALPDGTQIGVDYLTCAESPRFLMYEDAQILRTMGRYDIGLYYVPAQ